MPRTPIAFIVVLLAAAASADDSTPDKDGFEKQVKPLLARYCTRCHGGKEKTGGLAFDQFQSVASVLEKRSVWQKMARNLNARIMPPDGELKPTTEEAQFLMGWIERETNKVNCGLRDPGRVTIRRLNRAEYNNTIRDLLGIDFRPADDFPADDVGYGFDNIGDVLSLPTLLMEKYLAAAEQIADKAIVTTSAEGAIVVKRTAKEMDGGEVVGTSRGLYSSGRIQTEVKIASDGEYLIRIGAYGDQAGGEPAKMAVTIDRQRIKELDVPATDTAPGLYELKLPLKAGSHRVAMEFTNDYYMPRDPNPDNRDRNLIVQSLEVIGPLGVDKPAAKSTDLITCRPKDSDWRGCVETILRRFATRAFRRPVTDSELARLLKLVEMAQADGDTFEQALRWPVQAVLCSPHFLFRIELDRPTQAISDYELATRLSYFLWSSMPDEALFELAGKGTLHQPEVLESQVRRMLQDPKSFALVENFADQWLQIRNLRNVSPSQRRFSSFNDKLRLAMGKETQLFFQAIMKEDRSVLEFLDADFTFLNEQLAKHYGIEGVTGEEFQRVSLDSDQRGGVITQASVLTVTSNPTRTSPVKRGKWILEQILGAPPPPPPPGVPELPSGREVALSGTLRQRMEQHRSDPSCAACHRSMDPLGFGLENYDGIGAWRTREYQFSIDATGELPDGRKFDGPKELKKILLDRSPEFVRSLSEKMLTYASGRGLEYYDKCAVDDIAAYVTQHDHRFTSLIIAVVQSDPFLKRNSKSSGAKP